MNDRRMGIGLIVIALAMLAGATLLYCGVGPLGRSASAGIGGWHPALGAIARALTLPIPTRGISDVRDVVPFVGLACAVAIVVFAAPPMGRALWDSFGHPLPALRWLITTSVIIVIAGLASAYGNDSMALSRGWLLRFAAGAGWAWLLGRYLPARWVRPVVVGMLVLGALASALALWHRADHGVRYFSWPIGTLTITAGLASVWTALAGGWLLSPRQAEIRGAMPRGNRSGLARVANWGGVLVAGLVAAYVLQQSGRRAAMLGCLAGIALVLGFILWTSRHRRITRSLVVFAGLVALAGAGWYVNHEAASGQRERAIPVALRFGYLRLCGKIIGDHPLLGVGPDMSVVHVTNAVAPLRADSPHLYHGGIDAAVHNEWAQAAVELGVPAALVYLALPVGLVFIALRRASGAMASRTAGTHARAEESPDIGAVMALVAGIVAVVVTEIGSITLRGPMMPPWYWTMLGLLIAASREPISMAASSSAGIANTSTRVSAASADAAASRLTTGGRMIGLAVALLCAVIVHREYLSARAESAMDLSRGAEADRANMVERLFAEKTIIARYRAAELALVRVQAMPRLPSGRIAITTDAEEQFELAAQLWSELYELIPGLGGVIENYASIQLLAQRYGEARDALRRAIEEKLDPYSAGVNKLYARLPGTPPLEKYRCVQRALRGSAMGGELSAISRAIMSDPQVEADMGRVLDSVPTITQREHDSDWLDGLEPETLRLLADDMLAKEMGEYALMFQSGAAQFYRRLEEINSPYRRGHAAEADAFERLAYIWFTQARWLNWREVKSVDDAMRPIREALDAIRAAERYAVLGLPHDRLAHPQPELGFVFGEVMPTAFPERLRPLWRFSALLHLMAGKDQFIDLRIYFSLPPKRWTPQEMQREMAVLAGEAVTELSKLPVDLRPKHFAGLQALANSAN